MMAFRRVFVIAGQSNLQGDNDSGDLPTGVDPPFTDVPYWYWIKTSAGTFTSGGALVDMDLVARGGGPKFGPSLMFSEELRRAGVVHAVIEVTRNASALANGATPDLTWSPANTDVGALWLQLVTEVTNAFAALAAAFPADTLGISAFVWVQGSQDAGVQADALAYGTNLTNLIATFRSTFAAFIVSPVEAALVYNLLDIQGGKAFLTDVRDGQLVVSGLAAPQPAPMINIDDVPLVDQVHWTAAGQITVGERLGARYLEDQLTYAGTAR